MDAVADESDTSPSKVTGEHTFELGADDVEGANDVFRVRVDKAERRTATTKTVRETEAEAIAFVVGKTIGLSTGRASADYVVFAVM